MKCVSNEILMKTKLEVKDKTNKSEGFKIEPFRQHIRKTQPHKHNNYFEIIFLNKGKGSHTIDSKTYNIKPPTVFTIRKEQVHCWNIETKPEGFVLLLKKAFLEQCLDVDIKRMISKLSAHNCFTPKDHNVKAFFELLCTENEKALNSNKLVTEGLLKALLAKLLESVVAEPNMPGENSQYETFIELLNKELKNSVSHYAFILNTTPQNLNAICRKETGQSATEILSDHLISEAKRLLAYTDFTVSEISNQLQFKDNSHFTKYFKRYQGKTPKSYRQDLI